VLHNVGNAINSVNVSVSVAIDQIRHSRLGNLGKTTEALEHASAGEATPLGEKAVLISRYLRALAAALEEEQRNLLHELQVIKEGVDHVTQIVAMQQQYATAAGLIEPTRLIDIVEDAVRMSSSALQRHGVILKREYEHDPVLPTDRHKVLQILVNLIQNAKHACGQSNCPEKAITVRVHTDGERATVCVVDNGIGIAADTLDKIFRHGFTTRKDGHGFGLHSGSIAAHELGGRLIAASNGVGAGATFTLELPLQPKTDGNGSAAK
jgi:signal transduction histidine kinase